MRDDSVVGLGGAGGENEAFRLGAVPTTQLALFIVRALVPARMQRGLLNTYFLARQRRLMAKP